jgi:penicillin-binding protein 1C
VLPNSPTLIHPGKNRSLLKDKRDRLLDKLFKSGKLDSLTCFLAKAEPIPEEPLPLPRYAAHLLTRMKKDGLLEKKLISTIDYDLQQRVEQVMSDHHQVLKANHIFNGAALILDVKSGSTLAYVGNVSGREGNRGNDVDIITASRSTGSILKPFLFAAAMDEGTILPHTLVPDVPVFMNGFSPKNFSKQYDGAVHASDALIRSLNVPAVFLLKDYRYEKFYTLLNNLGLSTLHKPADHYGLSLILGGAEGSLWDITGMYASMARTLNNYFEHPGKDRYVRDDFHPPYYYQDTPPSVHVDRDVSSWLSASSIYLTFESLKELYRPEEESGWKYFSTTRKIAWKTGTSFGFRDGWAIGVTPEYAVGIWVGNADGEGRPGLTGIKAAAPILFDIFSALPDTRWFDKPMSEMENVITCRRSGHRASHFCESVDTLLITRKGLESPVCIHHKVIHLSPDERYQVHSGCSEIASMVHVNWFVLPPVEEHYFKKKNTSYKSLPPWQANCESASLRQPMDLVYPKAKARLFIPRDFNGQPGSSIFELAHADENIAVYWHLDGQFIGSTRRIHKLPVNPPEGPHVLTVIDERGQSIEEQFTVISSL